MHLFADVTPLRAFLNEKRKEGLRWGFVPTMGALHEGHLSLIKRSNADNDFTVASIYVNPAQFNNPDDLAKYPRTLESDRQMLEAGACAVLFAPTDAQMYPNSPQISIHFGSLEQKMEGEFRPGHFNGVALVVSKLLHLVQPEVAYFGQKDLQQFAIINQLVQDLSFPVKLVRCPTVRESDGLAMSSRNRRLDPEQRRIAVVLYWALQEAKEALLATKSVLMTKEVIGQIFYPLEGVFLEYFEVVDTTSLTQVKNLNDHQEIALCIAAYVGDIRLIDNFIVASSEWQ